MQAPWINIKFEDNLEGHYNFGKEIGTKLKKWIKHTFDNDTELSRMEEFVNDRPDIFNNFVNESTKAFPLYTKEIEGMSEGAEQPLKRMFINQLREELAQWIYDDMPRVGHCSTTFSYDQKNKISILAQNDDWTQNYRKEAYCIFATVLEPNSDIIKYKFISWSYPGFLPGSDLNVNSYGIAFTCNSLFPKKFLDHGIGTAWIIRNSLTSKDIN